MNVSSGMPVVYNPQDQPDKEGGRDDGSQKSDDSTAAQQHIEQPNLGYVAPTLINSEQLDEKVTGLPGYKKTNAILSEMKKNYKLNMLKNFIDQEAENVRAGGSKITPTAKTTQMALMKQSTISQNTDNQSLIRQQVATQFKNFQRDIVDLAQL